MSGKVTFAGKPLPLGTISFYPQSGKHEVINCLVHDGTYSQEGIPTGEVKVSVVTVDPDTGGKGANAEPGSGGDGGARSTPGGAEKKSSKFVPIPSRYADPGNSGLSLTVQTGGQDFDVELVP